MKNTKQSDISFIEEKIELSTYIKSCYEKKG